MFCPNCGTNLADGARFCNNCGKALEQSAPQSTAQPAAAQPTAPQPAPVAQNSKKKLITVCIAVCAVIALAVGIIAGVNAANNTAENVAEKFVTAAMSGDPESLVECWPDFMVREYAERNDLFSVDRKLIANRMKADIELDDIKPVSIISSFVDPTMYDREEFLEEAEDFGATQLELLQIEEFAAVKVNAIVAGDSRTYSVLCMKIDGDWYALTI